MGIKLKSIFNAKQQQYFSRMFTKNFSCRLLFSPARQHLQLALISNFYVLSRVFLCVGNKSGPTMFRIFDV